MIMPIKLNCDLGEGENASLLHVDRAVMPYIDQANIACGFHAGNPGVMRATLNLAKEHGVQVGAHPSYNDREGFGRRSMNLHPSEIRPLLLQQISVLDSIAKAQGQQLTYVKPHGALYNDMMANSDIRKAIMDTIAQYQDTHQQALAFMAQATPEFESHLGEAKASGIELWLEAFADRCYASDGKLLSRSIEEAVHNHEKMLEQVMQITETSSITTKEGSVIELQIDSLCVHGDNKAGVEAIAQIRELIQCDNIKNKDIQGDHS